MLIRNEFTVAAPAALVWDELVDPRRVALCLPGAEVTGREGEDHVGRVTIRIGPMTARFSGRLRFADLDPEQRRAVLTASGRDTRGSGNAAATITTAVVEESGLTRVSVETDLRVMGRLAQFGSGVMQQVATRLLDDFVQRLEARLADASPSA